MTSPTTSPIASDSDSKTLPPTEPSLCISRVFPNISERRIRAIFNELNFGDIDHVDIVHKQGSSKDGKPQDFNRVFVHFKRWNTKFDDLRLRLIQHKGQKNSHDGKPSDDSFFKIVYDDPWYWLVSANTAQKYSTKTRPKPSIII